MLNNDAGFNLIDLETLFGNDNLVNVSPDWICSGVSTDTRTLSEGDIFVALKGEVTDGHDKVPAAFLNGATGAIVNRAWYNDNFQLVEDMPLVLVEDTLESLAMLAWYHRRQFNMPVIAVGGSNGKTTTKDLIAHVLESKYNILKTYGNYNNRIGVPLMLLQLSYEHHAAVIEIGTNEPGEIYTLSKMVEPTHGLVTNIGREHLEKLIDLDGVEQEETFLFGFLNKHDRKSFINMDDVRLRKYDMVLENKFRFGTRGHAPEDNTDLIVDLQLNEQLTPVLKFRYEGLDYTAVMKTKGASTGLNAIAAIAVALELGMRPNEIIPKIESFEFTRSRGYGRMLVDSFAGILLINDCYNANPDSMESAIRTLGFANAGGRKYAALGDMLELGDASVQEHINIQQKAAEVAEKVFLYGKNNETALEQQDSKANMYYYTDKQAMAEDIFSVLGPGDALLVKGSRGMRMEELIDAFYKRFGQ